MGKWNVNGTNPGQTYYYTVFAHNSVPLYSTAQIVASSPLSIAPGDFDQDDDVDLEDFGHIQACLTGNGYIQDDPACQDAKLDADPDVDNDDIALFLDCLSGPNVPADLNCDVVAN